jgi:hypothetical protein
VEQVASSSRNGNEAENMVAEEESRHKNPHRLHFYEMLGTDRKELLLRARE